MNPTKSRHILIVDDNHAIHEDFAKVLSPNTIAQAEVDEMDAMLFGETKGRVSQVHFEMHHAFQGQEALALVEQSLKNGVRYPVAFVDVRMPPGWDGIETVSRLWQVDPDIQIVICTAYSEYSWDAMIAKLGQTDKLLILKKPFDNIEVQQLANALTGKWELLQETKNQLALLEEKVKERTLKLETVNGSLQKEIDHHKQTAEALRQSQETVLRQERLAVVGQLSAGIAHEFNNILTVIVGHTNLLLTTGNHDSGTVHSLRLVCDSAERAASLTKQMLAFSRQQLIHPQPLDLGKAMAHLAGMFRGILGENITVQCRFEPDLPSAWADPRMVEQIAMNLVVNARDAMPDGGCLTISALASDTPDVIANSNVVGANDRREGEFVCFSVSDTGTGMDEATMKRIFEPFFTTKDVGKGTGLGLATVYGIVQQHEGWVEARSVVGKGTTFRVYLPVRTMRNTSPQQPTPPAEAITNPSSKKGKILVVEDEAIVRELACFILRDSGYEVFEAGSGPEALKLCEQKKGDIDLLFTDMIMPEGMSGRELAARLKVITPNLRVVFTSGYNEESVKKKGGREVYLPKPYNPVQLIQVISHSMQSEPKNCIPGITISTTKVTKTSAIPLSENSGIFETYVTGEFSRSVA